jgi:hypothetical protein
VLAGPWVKNALWRRARAVPSLDLRFAENKSLVNATTGQNLVTFTRASSGTYVGSDGLIKTATTNLLLRSEEFGTTWSVAGTASITADQAAAPNGTTTADRITVTSGGPNRVLQAGVSATSTTYTFSIYAKSDDINGICIRAFFSGGTLIDTYSNFVFGSKTFSDTGGSGTFAFQELQNGWFRLSITIASGNNTAWEFRIGGLITTAQTGTKAFLWGAQLEQSSTVGEYIPTTSTINSAPRFDHNPTTGESLGLLVEEQRTNLARNSILAGGTTPTSWSLGSTAVPVVASSIYGNADGATALSFTTNADRNYLIQSVAIAANTTYVFSVYTEAGSYSGTLANVISLNNGPAGSTITGASGNAAAGIRATVTIVNGATAGNVQLRIGLGVGSNATGTIVLSRPQLEAGASPTSYIPTTTATVTRAADVASITGSNFSSWYRQDEGTLYIESTKMSIPVTTSTTFADLNDGTLSNRSRFWIWSGATSTLRFTPRASNADQADLTIGTPIQNIPFKAAGSLKANDFAAVLNGGTVSTDGSGTVPTVDRLTIGNSGSANEQLGGTIKRLVYWGQRLPNTTLQGITQ